MPQVGATNRTPSPIRFTWALPENFSQAWSKRRPASSCRLRLPASQHRAARAASARSAQSGDCSSSSSYTGQVGTPGVPTPAWHGGGPCCAFSALWGYYPPGYPPQFCKGGGNAWVHHGLLCSWSGPAYECLYTSNFLGMVRHSSARRCALLVKLTFCRYPYTLVSNYAPAQGMYAWCRPGIA